MSKYVGREHRTQGGFIPRCSLWFCGKANAVDVESRVGDRVWEIGQHSPRCTEPIDACETTIASVQYDNIEYGKGSEKLVRQRLN